MKVAMLIHVQIKIVILLSSKNVILLGLHLDIASRTKRFWLWVCDGGKCPRSILACLSVLQFWSVCLYGCVYVHALFECVCVLSVCNTSRVHFLKLMNCSPEIGSFCNLLLLSNWPI